MGLLNPGGPVAQFKRNRCSISPVELILQSGVRTHRMEIVNDIYKKLHDLDYFLLRYGPKDVAKYVEDDSTVSKYYGTLPFY